MRSFLVSLFLFASFGASAQGLIFSQVESLPSTLRLQQGGFVGGITHSQISNGSVEARVGVIFFDGLEKNLSFPGVLEFLNCKGEYAFITDFHGMRSIAVERLDLCVDSDGVPLYVRPGLSRQDYDSLYDNLLAELLASPMGGERERKDFENLEAHEAEQGVCQE